MSRTIFGGLTITLEPGEYVDITSRAFDQPTVIRLEIDAVTGEGNVQFITTATNPEEI